jgi:hypothetical protein
MMLRYNMDLWITENGVSMPNEGNMDKNSAVNDQFRLDYFTGYLDEVCKAVKWVTALEGPGPAVAGAGGLPSGVRAIVWAGLRR